MVIILEAEAFFVGVANGKVVGTAGVRKFDGNLCEIRRIYLKSLQEQRHGKSFSGLL